MALTHSKTTRSLKDTLYKNPYEFEFVQIVRLMHHLFPDATPLGVGTNPQKEAVELKSHVFLSAPPSDVFKITLSPPPLASDMRRWTGGLSNSKAIVPYTPPPQPLLEDGRKAAEKLSPPQISVNFLGIAGIQGPLPLPYTEALLNHLRQKDTVFRDFLDIFNHRLLSLYYRIEQKFNPPLSLSPPQETVKGQALEALTGWTKTSKNLPFTSRNLLFYASFFWQKPHNPYALKVILQTHFDLPVEISSFQGAWIPLPLSERTRLGGTRLGQQNILGESAVLGRRAWCQHAGIIIHLRLKDFQNFQRFLPFGDNFPALKELISFYLGPLFSFKIALSLEQKPSHRLGSSSFYLGWTSWLGQITLPKNFRDQEVILRVR